MTKVLEADSNYGALVSMVTQEPRADVPTKDIPWMHSSELEQLDPSQLGLVALRIARTGTMFLVIGFGNTKEAFLEINITETVWPKMQLGTVRLGGTAQILLGGKLDKWLKKAAK